MWIARRLRARGLADAIAEERAFLLRRWTAAEIEARQLERLNPLWREVRSRVPFYRELGLAERLPESFSSLGEFRDRLPPLDRRTVKRLGRALIDPSRPADFWRKTGGSTAEPLQIPAWKTEIEAARADVWAARSWFGVAPSDRLFLIWGHSHLLGDGFRGRAAGALRQLKDALLGYRRWSAYDLSEERMRAAGAAMLRSRPAYVLGYSAALDRFAGANRGLAGSFRKLHLKAAFATGESFPRPQSREEIAEVLGCPVAMEYGSVETGTIAHERPGGGYAVFWRRSILEAEEAPAALAAGGREALVTSLFPRAFPLLRYRVGDLVAGVERAGVVSEFSRVIGRANDSIVLSGGVVVHSEAFAHATRESPALAGFQVRQAADGSIALRYLAAAPLSAEELGRIRRRLGRIDPELGDVELVHVRSLEQTVAGKTLSVRRETA